MVVPSPTDRLAAILIPWQQYTEEDNSRTQSIRATSEEAFLERKLYSVLAASCKLSLRRRGRQVRQYSKPPIPDSIPAVPQ